MKPGRAVVICWLLMTTAGADELKAPPLELPSPAGLARVRVREFRFEGNTVFSDSQLLAVLADYREGELSGAELQECRQLLTEHYVRAGYVNSGAILPDQSVAAGIVTFQIVEGELSSVRVEDNRWLRDDYIASRLRRRAGRPLNVGALRDGLGLLRLNPNVEQVNAELRPGGLPGAS